MTQVVCFCNLHTWWLTNATDESHRVRGIRAVFCTGTSFMPSATYEPLSLDAPCMAHFSLAVALLVVSLMVSLHSTAMLRLARVVQGFLAVLMPVSSCGTREEGRPARETTEFY